MFHLLWETFLIKPIFNLLVILMYYTGNLGVAIIILTILIRLVSFPLFTPMLKSAKKQNLIKPELDKLKEKYKNDKQVLAAKQLELYKEHGLNPAAGIFSQILVFMLMIALWGVINRIATNFDPTALNNLIYLDMFKFTSTYLNTKFLYLDLSKPDPYYALVILSGVFQFLLSWLSMRFNKPALVAAKKTPAATDDFAYQMQKQMLYSAPVLTVIIGIKLPLPSGVVLYYLVTTIFSALQTYLFWKYDYGSDKSNNKK